MKIGIIDIGARATRLLIGDTDDLNEFGFRFSDCRNWGKLTEAGQGIYKENNNTCFYRIEYLEKTVEYLNFLINNKCRKHNVAIENIYAVGTEIFRRISNWKDVVSIIKNTCGVDLKVLDPKEEAECTFWAAIISCREFFDIDEPILVLEQGGGSMQLTVASVNAYGKPQRYGQASIAELGTLLLREQFLLHRTAKKRVSTVNRDVHQFAKDKVGNILSTEFSLLNNQVPLKVFALGSVITNLFKLSNPKIHGKTVNLTHLQTDPVENTILEKYKTYQVSSLLKDSENGQIQESLKDINIILERSYGLPCYAAVMEYFNLENLRICGTGLRYGVYFRVTANEWLDIREYQGC